MASSRKKQDEKNVKLLRDIASLSHNKYCFDCNQRGPTYVNVTVGSFVCTKCSGILRGLTPPHRVKSISMASFTQEEIELLQARGNEYCRQVWLGLYEGALSLENRDEQVIRDFMTDKYERKRYYLDPLSAPNGKIATKLPTKNLAPNLSSKTSQINGIRQDRSNCKPINGKLVEFIPDFGSADIYNAINANKDTGTNHNNNNNNTVIQLPFANFDDNPVFSGIQSTDHEVNNWSFINFDAPFVEQRSLFPAYDNLNKQWSAGTFDNVAAGPPAPPEDRYAALKALDNALKVQPQLDWNSGSNDPPYNSTRPPGPTYDSPNLGQFNQTTFQDGRPRAPNPFHGGTAWNNNGHQTLAINPFRAPPLDVGGKMNGALSSICTPTVPLPNVKGNPWVPNPFKVGTSATAARHSNNPFL